ncbi:MAG: NAD(P)H-binding protein [Bacteroidetes bacterium]|nr:NAD(P)H-binding protein [Bacteroidota bacterium]
MRAVLIGATGLVGNYLLEALLADDYFDQVRILVRRPFAQTHPKLENVLVDFNDGDSILVALNNCDVAFCAIGTTQQKVKGDKAAYRKVDYDIPVNLARFCKMTGCEKLVLVSAVGANAKSGNFYLKLKGEVEEAVIKEGLKSIHIMRPSVLLGERTENRTGERIAKALIKTFSFLVPSRYKAIHGRDVANAMIRAAKKGTPGVTIYEYKEMI